jgi:hypothetical protein
LAQLEIPSGVTTIGKFAFCGCVGLAQLKIPLSVTRIGEYAFGGCSGLTRLEVPSRSSSLGDRRVFMGMTKVERRTLLGSPLLRVIVLSLRDGLTPAAMLIGPALVGRKFDRFSIVAA